MTTATMPARLEPRDDPQVVIVRESRSLSVLGILVAILLATAAGGAGSWYFLQHMLAQEQQARQETLAAWQHMALQELARQTREQIESAALTSAGERQLIDSSLGRRLDGLAAELGTLRQALGQQAAAQDRDTARLEGADSELRALLGRHREELQGRLDGLAARVDTLEVALHEAGEARLQGTLEAMARSIAQVAETSRTATSSWSPPIRSVRAPVDAGPTAPLATSGRPLPPMPAQEDASAAPSTRPSLLAALPSGSASAMAGSDAAPPVSGTSRRVARSVYWRREPGTEMPQGGVLSEGQTVQILGESNGWQAFQAPDGTLGYVHANSLAPP